MRVGGELMDRLVWGTSVLSGNRAEYWVILRERTLSRFLVLLTAFLLSVVSILLLKFLQSFVDTSGDLKLCVYE